MRPAPIQKTLMSNEDLLRLTSQIAASYVGNNRITAEELPALITRIHVALNGLGKAVEKPPAPIPAVPIRKSITPDAIISLEDGKPYKTLKRHLKTAHGMTPAEYRAKWGLPADYPMIAPNYAEKRSELARSRGLGSVAGRRGATSNGTSRRS